MKNKRLKSALLILLLMSSYVSPTSASKNEEPPAEEQLELLLKKNDQAPYDGVLIPFDSYQDYQISLHENDSLNQKVVELSKVTLESETFWTTKTILGCTIGALAGTFLALLIHR